ncbi:MAG: serine/threonine-protein kinase, partial [Chloroflexota bacterium]
MTDTQQFNSTDTLIKSIDRYIVGERIGTGGMARVFRAKDKSLDRDVAVKVLHEHLADDDTFRARFEREAKFLASFHHPNVIQIYDYATVEEDSRYLCYMVMTYLPGNTLNDVMEENKAQDRLMPQQQVLQIIKDIAAALDYAHAAGMVHRDVKPGNILFDERGRAILTDFGIARMVEYS